MSQTARKKYENGESLSTRKTKVYKLFKSIFLCLLNSPRRSFLWKMKGVSQYLRVELCLEKSQKMQICYICRTLPDDYKVTGGLEVAKKVCVCCFCMFSVSLE